MRRLMLFIGVLGVLTGAIVAIGGMPATPASAAPAQPPRVTLIGDSIAKALEWNEEALKVLGKGIDLQLEVDVCRRLTGKSCPFDERQASTLVELAGALGPRLGQTVIVVTGYNDFEQTFAQSIDASVAALRRAGVTRILWTTLRAARHPYLNMNDDIRSAAARYPDVTVVDWNRYSRSHPDWFQNDGLHLFPAGGLALATLLRKALDEPASLEADTPPAVVTKRLPVARQGKRYWIQLQATGGTDPLKWRLLSGPLPKGLRLRANGSISGSPRVSIRTTLLVSVTDADGLQATQHLDLLIKPRVAKTR
jgi:hypothetical protein